MGMSPALFVLFGLLFVTLVIGTEQNTENEVVLDIEIEEDLKDYDGDLFKKFRAMKNDPGSISSRFKFAEGLKCKGLNSGCCTEAEPCDEGDGDCDRHTQCKTGFCGSNNCAWGGGDDCCVDKSKYRCSGENNGCCTVEKPCAENEGDCDDHDQCQAGLICGSGNCPWGTGDDCCVNVDKFRCKGKGGGCCTERRPCGLGDGDCDNDNQCGVGLICGSSNCAWGSGDCCREDPKYTPGCRPTDDGGCCALPFVYKAKTYTECTYVGGYTTPWCSLTTNYDKDGDWDYCKPCQKTEDGQCCALPFKYKGVEYNDCTSVDAKRPWCSLTYNYGKEKKYAYCEVPKPTPARPKCLGESNGCCTKEKPCGEAEGDCDDHDECQKGLVCGSANCPVGVGTFTQGSFFSSGSDCCFNIDKYRCKGIGGGCCTKRRPCDMGDGDCDYHYQCKEGLRCGSSNCEWGSGDCCEKDPDYIPPATQPPPPPPPPPTTTPPPPPTPPPVACPDKLTAKQCAQYASGGACTKNEAYMSSQCRTTCEIGGCINHACSDFHASCGAYVQHNYCTVHALFMKYMCKKSCNLCG